MTDSWLAALHRRLPRHAELLEALIELCRADERLRVLEIQCSVARGVGDQLSDLDVGIGAEDGAWEPAAADLVHRLRDLAPTVDLLAHQIPEWGTRPHRRLFVQYADGRQLDLVVQPASVVSGRAPEAVVLYDPDGRLATERRHPLLDATADQVRAWEVEGWELLANVTKYLVRGSAWEARARLEDARERALRLWAVGRGVAYPAYGLVGLLDADPPLLPDGLEATVSGLDPHDIGAAARSCAALLRSAAAGARARIGTLEAESPMADWVSERLEAYA